MSETDVPGGPMAPMQGIFIQPLAMRFEPGYQVVPGVLFQYLIELCDLLKMTAFAPPLVQRCAHGVAGYIHLDKSGGKAETWDDPLLADVMFSTCVPFDQDDVVAFTAGFFGVRAADIQVRTW